VNGFIWSDVEWIEKVEEFAMRDEASAANIKPSKKWIVCNLKFNILSNSYCAIINAN
jgi:hypothetical protein